MEVNPSNTRTTNKNKLKSQLSLSKWLYAVGLNVTGQHVVMRGLLSGRSHVDDLSNAGDSGMPVSRQFMLALEVLDQRAPRIVGRSGQNE